jgi:hypothetical protein
MSHGCARQRVMNDPSAGGVVGALIDERRAEDESMRHERRKWPEHGITRPAHLVHVEI